MKFYSFLILVQFLSFQLNGKTELHTGASPVLQFGCSRTTPHNPSIKSNRSGLFKDVLFAVGLSAGQETFIGLPKLSAYKAFPLLSKNNKSPKYGFHRYSIYAGADVSTFVFFAGVFTASGNVGFVAGPVTLDNSLAFTVVSSPESENSNYSTCNPKLGLIIGPIWLKAGPSFAVHGNPDWGNWMKKNGTCYNVELHYLFPSRKKSMHH
jgi:hypothetical protein